MGYFSNLAIEYPPGLQYCATCDQPLTGGRCMWCHPSPPPALLTKHCPCGQRLGSSYCRCGRAFSSVAPRALGVGAGSVVVAPSRRSPSGLVALCAFASPSGYALACSFARACPDLFGVAPPFVRRSGPAWVVSVPVSSYL